MEVNHLIEHVKKSTHLAYHNQSKLPDEIMSLDGMTGTKTRHMYNNICSLGYKNYLEVGTWKGSSFISALYHNNLFGYCVDNWETFDGPKDEFLLNISKHLKKEKYSIIDKDCWKLTENDIHSPIDIFLYDGDHSYESHLKAITFFHKFFSKYVIIMIDDWACWDFPYIKEATLRGLKEMNMKIHYQEEIGLVNTNRNHYGIDTFWNGCGIFVCERTDI